jgi:uncharacterized repeat protein (TIGR01451 family)
MSRRIALCIGLSLALFGTLAIAVTGALAAAEGAAPDSPGRAQASSVPGQPPADVQTVTFIQGVDDYHGCADTRISAEEPDENFAEGELALGMRGDIGVLIRFDVSSIPANARVLEATLGLRGHNWGPRGPEPAICAAYAVTRTWTETEATWHRARRSDKWGLPGCNDTQTDRSPTELSRAALHERDVWYRWSVTPAVQQWVSDPASNNGIYIRQTNTEVPGEYDIRESEYPGPDQRPYLIVEYTLSPPPPSISVTKEPTSVTVQLSESVPFTLRVENTGDSAITQLTVTDTYDSDYLSFVSSSPEADEQEPGVISWTGLGPLGPGMGVDLAVEFQAILATEETTNILAATGVDEYAQYVGPEAGAAVVTIEPRAVLYLPMVARPITATVAVCSSEGRLVNGHCEGDCIYKVAKTEFEPYKRNPDGTTALRPDGTPDLRQIPSGLGPAGWKEPGFAPGSGWQPGGEVDWHAWQQPKWQPWPEAGDVQAKIIGLVDAGGAYEFENLMTHLYRREFDLQPPAGMSSDARIVEAILMRWSDNYSWWWWNGADIPTCAQGWFEPVSLLPEQVAEGGGTYVLAIQNSNGDLGTETIPDPHGTAFCLKVTWEGYSSVP